MSTDVVSVLSIEQSAQWVVLALSFVLVLALTYLAGDVIRRLPAEAGALIPREGLPLRSPLPDVELVDRRRSAPLRTTEMRGQRALVAFLSSRCRPCLELVPHLNALAVDSKGTRFLVIVPSGASDDYLRELDRRIAVAEDTPDFAVAAAFDARVSPLVYVADEEGLVTMRAVSNTRLQLEDALDGYGEWQVAAWRSVDDVG